MHIKALTAAIMVVVFAGSIFSTTQAKALSQTSINSKSTVATSSQPTQPVPASTPAVTSVTVASGQSLSSLATQYNTTYIRLYDDNSQIQNPDLIFVGELINIPSSAQQLPDRYGQFESALVASQASQVVTQPKANPDSEASQPSTTVQPVAQVAASASVWTEIAQCESGGNWSIDTGNGFYGGLQFTLSSWQAVGGVGLPSQASESQQIALAQKLQALEGWSAWPVCSAKLGL